MKSIKTLIPDIQEVLLNGAPVSPEQQKELGETLAKTIVSQLNDKRQSSGTLRMSNIGTPCDRKLWYKVNKPELAAPLTPEAKAKFMFGHIIEDLLMFLVKIAGHTVSGEQDEFVLEGIKGHRDGVIDGTLVDVKSAAASTFGKFQYGSLADNDDFGYVPQITAYLETAQDDPTVTEKDKAAFLVIDKQHGNLCLDYHSRDPKINELFQKKKEMVKGPRPDRGYDSVPEGKSGNRKLCTNCSFCDFKNDCWPGLKTFQYAKYSLDLCHVAKLPRVPEVVDTTLEYEEL